MIVSNLKSLRFGVALGVTMSIFYLICIVLMTLGGSSLSIQILNSIFHGLDFSSLVNTEVSIGRRLVGLLGTFFLGVLFGSILAFVYKFLCGEVEEFKIMSNSDFRQRHSFNTKGDIVFYKSILSEGPLILLFVVLSFCAFYHSIKYPSLTDYVSIGFIESIPLPLLAIAPLVLLAYIIHQLFDRRYVIGSNYVRSIKGVLSINKSDMRLAYKDIRGIEIDRSLYGRIFDIGTIRIGSAMADNVEIEMPGVAKPSHMRDEILARQNKFEFREDLEALKESKKEVDSD